MMRRNGDGPGMAPNVPLHSFKYISELQYTAGRVGSQAGRHKGPFVIRIESKAGHGAGKPTEKICEEGAELYAFLCKQLGVAL